MARSPSVRFWGSAAIQGHECRLAGIIFGIMGRLGYNTLAGKHLSRQVFPFLPFFCCSGMLDMLRSRSGHAFRLLRTWKVSKRVGEKQFDLCSIASTVGYRLLA
jgi:hypothetical protein